MNDVIEKPDPEMTFQDKALARFQEAIVEACQTIPELQQVAVIFDWVGELNRGAVPFVIGDQHGPLGVNELHNIHGMLEQHAKSIAYLSQLLSQSLERHEELCNQMETRFREAQAQEKEGTQHEGQEQAEEPESSEQDADASTHGDGSRFD